MANQRDRIILFPRYTTFAGAMDFATVPINVTSYEAGDVVVWIGDVVGPIPPGPVVPFFEESTDQVRWTVCDGASPVPLASGQETQFLPELRKPWMRLRISVGSGAGADPVVSCYAVGYLERRKGASP